VLCSVTGGRHDSIIATESRQPIQGRSCRTASRGHEETGEDIDAYDPARRRGELAADRRAPG